MSKTTIYRCDRCGKESEDMDKLGLTVVAIGVRHDRQSTYWSNHEFMLFDDIRKERRPEMELCKDCLHELGIRFKDKEENPAADSCPSLEEMIRIIAREEIEAYSPVR